MKLYRLFAAALALAAALTGWAQAPANYYSKCENKCAGALLEALEDAISDHTNVGYNGLWTLFRQTDTYPNGKVWDMYCTKEWTFSTDQCGNYSGVGDCYNREHSMPKSWFGDQSPMVSDAFHIYPTDGRVNGQRSNYPYGECAGGSTLSAPPGIKALGKLGASTFPGYSGTVFEPDDQYKGDFARSYFYMAACYNSHIDDWDSPMLAGNSYPAFSAWAVDLLMKWHRQDPVSQKELDRNEAVFAAQHNRNPFIDHPEMAEHIWGSLKAQGWKPGAPADPAIVMPADGSTLNLGSATALAPKTATIAVRATALQQPVSITVAGAPDVTVSPASIPAAQACSADGASVIVSWTPSAPGSLSGSITLASGSAKSTVALAGTAYAGIVAFDAEDITTNSFKAGWTYVGDPDRDGKYWLWVWPSSGGDDWGADGAELHLVEATDCSAVIAGLEEATNYSYQICTQTQESNVVSFRTGSSPCNIILLGTFPIEFVASEGEPSAPADVIMITDNIASDIEVEVDAPFEVSSDKAFWGRSIEIDPMAEGFYVRVNSSHTGTFLSPIRLKSDTYENDDYTLSAIVTLNSGIASPAERKPDAFCRAGRLMLEAPAAANARVYTPDGIVIFDGPIPAGLTPIPATPGLYLVAIDGMERPKRVPVK